MEPTIAALAKKNICEKKILWYYADTAISFMKNIFLAKN